MTVLKRNKPPQMLLEDYFWVAANKFSLEIIWNSWNRCDIRWFILRNFSVQVRAQRSYKKTERLQLVEEVIQDSLELTSFGLTLLVVKSFTQSMKQSSVSRLYCIRNSFSWKRQEEKEDEHVSDLA